MVFFHPVAVLRFSKKVFGKGLELLKVRNPPKKHLHRSTRHVLDHWVGFPAASGQRSASVGNLTIDRSFSRQPIQFRSCPTEWTFSPSTSPNISSFGNRSLPIQVTNLANSKHPRHLRRFDALIRSQLVRLRRIIAHSFLFPRCSGELGGEPGADWRDGPGWPHVTPANTNCFPIRCHTASVLRVRGVR